MGIRTRIAFGIGWVLPWLAFTGVAPAETEPFRAVLDSAFTDVIRGNYYPAMQRYQNVLSADSTVAEAYRYLGWLQIVTSAKDPLVTADNLQKAVFLNPNDAGAYNDLGYTYAAMQTYAPALDAFGEAIRLQPDEPLFHRNLGMVAVESRDFVTSETAFRRTVALDPLDDLGHYGLGISLARLGQDDEALLAYRKALGINPDQKESYAGIGQVFVRRKQLREAVAQYDQVLRIDFRDPRAHYVLASIYQQLGDSVLAEQEMKKYRFLEEKSRYVVRDDYVFPVMLDRVAAFRLKGLTYARLGRYEEALAQFEKGLALADDSESPFRFSPEAQVLRLATGRAYQSIGEAAEARRVYRAVVAQADDMPEETLAQIALADVYLFLESVPEAEARTYERAVAMDPTSSAALWIYELLSQAHRAAGRLDRCIAAYEAMRAQTPDSPGLRGRLAAAYDIAGRPNEAVAEYLQAISLTGASEPLYRQLAGLYRRMGRVAAADSIEARLEAP